MMKSSFTLQDKKQLTHDVFELTYTYNSEGTPIDPENLPKPGQYILFQLAPGLNRAYSLASFSDTHFTLIIKRVPEGKGSPLLCDAAIGSSFSGMIPLGHFVLQDTQRSACFIGTGTGFAPLYCQLLASSISERVKLPTAFVFGVRTIEDVFYQEEIQKLGTLFSDFYYIPYLSREAQTDFEHGYVIDWVTAENIQPYEEFYLCGSPTMVKSAREKLEALGIAKETIYFEQF